jgi:16S rRNA (guanine527-N7)-methyltransferase
VTRRALDPIADLLSALEAIVGRPATASQGRQFKQYLELFLRWNRVHRMTALDSPSAIVDDLFIDSLLFLKLLPDHRPLAIVDIGAGAGIPGLPMQLADPGLRVSLVEATRKRLSFLRTACRELGLSEVAVLEGRAEQVVQEDRTLVGAFDVAVSRAVDRIDRLSPTALPYLKPGGLLVVSAPPKVQPSAGIELIRVQVPGHGEYRGFLTLRK